LLLRLTRPVRDVRGLALAGAAHRLADLAPCERWPSVNAAGAGLNRDLAAATIDAALRGGGLDDCFAPSGLAAWRALAADDPPAFDARLAQLAPGARDVLRRRLREPDASANADTDEPRELDLGALAGREPAPPAFIVPDWLPAGEVTLIAAHGGTGKSTAALHLAVCLALGLDFHGLHVEPRGVDFVSFEDSEAVLHWRVHRICRAVGVDVRELVGMLRLFDATRCTDAWYSRGELGAYGPTLAFHRMAERIGGPGRVVFVDGSSDTFAGNENDRAQVKAYLRMLRGFVAPDGALVLTSHVDKAALKAAAEAAGFSGSTGWHNGVRSRWFMYAEADDAGGETGRIVVELRKSNLARAGARMVLSFDEAAGIFRRVDADERRGMFQRVDESAAVVAAIRAAWDAGNPAPAAMTGQRTAHTVCEAVADLPASLRGRAGRGRFNRTVEQLRAAGRVRVEPLRKANRHVVEVLHVAD